MAVLLLFCPVSHAGTYVWQTTNANGSVTAESPAYTGGTVSANPSKDNSLLPFTTHPPYAPNTANPFYRGYALGGCNTDAQGNAASVTLTASGPLTAKFTWQPAYPGEPASTSVIVYQDCQATLTDNRNATADTSCVCVDGLGGNGPLPSNGTQTESYKYSSGTIMPDGTVSVSCTPQAVYNIKCPAGVGNYAAGEAFAAYKATAYPITISLTGTTPDSSGNQNILIGQGCTANVSGIPSSLINNATYNWSVSGNTFQSWNGESGTVPVQAVMGLGATNQSTAHWFWSDTAGSKTVTCAVTVTPPSGHGDAFTVTATAHINLEVPIWRASNSVGVGYVGNDPKGNLAMFAGPTGPMVNGTPAYANGSNWRTSVPIPIDFTGVGQWQYAQLVNAGEYYTPDGGTEKQTADTNITGLDDIFPYDTLHDTGGAFILDADSPEFFLLDTYSHVRLDDAFFTFLMFKPPLAPSAPQNSSSWVQWVPLAESDWLTPFSAARPASKHWADFPSATTVGQITLISDFQPQTKHPEWNTRILSK